MMFSIVIAIVCSICFLFKIKITFSEAIFCLKNIITKQNYNTISNVFRFTIIFSIFLFWLYPVDKDETELIFSLLSWMFLCLAALNHLCAVFKVNYLSTGFLILLKSVCLSGTCWLSFMPILITENQNKRYFLIPLSAYTIWSFTEILLSS